MRAEVASLMLVLAACGGEAVEQTKSAETASSTTAAASTTATPSTTLTTAPNTAAPSTTALPPTSTTAPSLLADTPTSRPVVAKRDDLATRRKVGELVDAFYLKYEGEVREIEAEFGDDSEQQTEDEKIDDAIDSACTSDDSPTADEIESFVEELFGPILAKYGHDTATFVRDGMELDANVADLVGC